MHDSSLEAHRKSSARTRDIGKPPANVGRDERREAADASLLAFLDTYFPEAFPLAWSDDHRRVIGILQDVATNGGLFTVAMPRGSGKTQITIRTAIWALLTGRRKHIAVVCSTDNAAKKIIKAIRSELSFNQDLKWDYIGELHGIWQLQGDNRRSGGQLCDGEKTGVVLGTTEIVFPTHKYTPIGGACVYSAGLTGNVRGRTHQLMDGSVSRPDFVILDDPQTRESAKSKAQTEDRISIVDGDVLGLAGPGQSIAAVMPCTVIEKGDLSEHFLDHHLWSAQRSKLLYKFPENLPLWDKYFEIREEQLRTDRETTLADQFLRDNWDEMHRGAVAGWEERKEPGELSAVQSAMHLWRRSPSAFAAEYQNEPLDASVSLDQPCFDALKDKITGLDVGIVPAWAQKLTCGIDVQQRALFWTVSAWSDDFTGSVIAYGCFPKQARSYFEAADVNPSLQVASGASSLEGALYWGLEKLVSELLSARFSRESGGEMTVSRLLVDANWGQSTDTVYEFCRRCPWSSIVTPSHGRGIKAGDRPMVQWSKKGPSEQVGFHWVHTLGEKQRAIRHVLFDSNFWKTFLAQRVMSMSGERGSLSLFGQNPTQHKLFLDHLGAESCTKTYGREREVWEWKARPGVDNHYLDTLVLSGVAASMTGCALSELRRAEEPKQRKRFSDLQKARR